MPLTIKQYYSKKSKKVKGNNKYNKKSHKKSSHKKLNDKNANIMYNFKIEKYRSFYKSFDDIISLNIILRYIKNELNSNELSLEISIVNTYKKIISNFFQEFRLINDVMLTPYPVINVNLYLENYYKNNSSGTICVLSNMYSQIIPFISNDINVNIIGKLKKNKILLFKNEAITSFVKNYEHIKDHLKIAKRNMIIEGSFEYDINNYLNNYISNSDLYKKKYDLVFLVTGYYMELKYPSKLSNYIVTALFNLKKGGKLSIYTSLLTKIDTNYDLFVLLSTIFTECKIIKHENSDFLTDYSYSYEFIDYHELSEKKLLELTNIILTKNPTEILNLKSFINFTEKNINDGGLLLTNIINESNKYAFFMENNINYFTKTPLNYVKFYVKFIMNRLFMLFNNVNKLTSFFNMNLMYKIIQKYYKNICCIGDYYKNLTIKLFKNSKDIDFGLQSFEINKSYNYDSISSLIYNIDIQKKITESCVKKPLPLNKYLLINNDIDKELLVDLISDYFYNIPINQPKIINNSTFIEHWELLNEFNTFDKISKINKTKDVDSVSVNHIHFGNNDSQFMSSLKYFIDVKYKNDIQLRSKYNNFTTNNTINNTININEYYDIVTCDDILDIEIGTTGSKIWNIDSKFLDDTINSSFNIMNDSDKDNLNNKIKDFEQYEFNKLIKLISLIKSGGSCYIKHVALPLNSYLFYSGYKNSSGFFINYLYLYFLMFEKVVLFRPTIIPNKSLEFYVVGLNFTGFNINQTEGELNEKDKRIALTMFLSKISKKFELHQTLFKKETISELFVEQINSFMNIMISRYIKFEEIKGMLTFTIIHKNNEKIKDNHNAGNISDELASQIVNNIELNQINETFLRKKALNQYLTETVYNNWKTKYIDVITSYKLYYFTKINKTSNNENVFDFSILEKLLDKGDFIKLNNKNDIIGVPNQASFIHFYLPGKNFVIPENLTLINLLNIDNVIYKNKLFNLCLKKNSSLTHDFIIESKTIIKDENTNTYEQAKELKDYSKLFNEHETWYVKIYLDTKNTQNNNNFLIKSFKEFNELITSNNATLSSLETFNYTLVLNKYPVNPLLYKNASFHLRIFYIPFINNEKIVKSYISKYGLMYLVNENQKEDKYFKDDKIDYIFPNHFTEEYGNRKTKKVFEQIINILQFISKAQTNHIYNYIESKNGYELLGADFIIDDKFNVKLLEINNNIKLSCNIVDNNKNLSEYLFTNIYNEIFTSVFGLNKINNTEEFVIL